MHRIFFTTVVAVIVLLSTCRVGQAGIIFTFTESGGNVLMTPSGTIDTAKLVAATDTFWGGTGIGNFTKGNTVAMIGGTEIGYIDIAFSFNVGTDFSAWAGGVPFSEKTFGWTPTGTKGFATYVEVDGNWEPGIHLLESQMVGSTWTPDQSWSISGTFASLQMNPGTYTVADILTDEFITYQIGAAVPEPSTAIAMALLGVVGFTGNRRRRRAALTA